MHWERFWEFKIGGMGVTRTKRQERQRNKRDKVKLKQAGVKSDIRKNFPSTLSHREFAREALQRFFSLKSLSPLSELTHNNNLAT